MLLYPHYLDILDEVIHFISIFWKVRKNIREEREREREREVENTLYRRGTMI